MAIDDRRGRRVEYNRHAADLAAHATRIVLILDRDEWRASLTQADDLRGRSFRDYLDMIWVRLWLVVAVTAVCAGAAFLFANSQTRMYEAAARLLYQPPTDVSNPTANAASVNTDSMGIQLQSVSSVIGSPKVRHEALAEMGGGNGLPKYTVKTTIVQPENSSVSAQFPNSIDITASTTSPASAARVANAYAGAIIALRKSDSQLRYVAAEKVVQDQLKLYATPQSKLTADYAILTQQLQNLKIAEQTATGDFAVIIPATPPSSPVSPQPMRSAALGLAFGLILGIALAFVASRFDTRVRSHREIAELLGLPVVGRIPRMKRNTARDGELVALAEPDGQVSEALRMLRTSLEWAGVDQSLHTLLVTSCVKGEGKTVTTCNLGLALARAGKRVIVVEGDLRAPRVHAVFHLPNVKGLTSVVLGKSDLEESIQVFRPSRNEAGGTKGGQILVWNEGRKSPANPDNGKLMILTSGPLPPDPGEFVASRRLATVLEKLDGLDVDYVLVDAPPILTVGDAAALSACVDGLLLVANVEKVRRPMLLNGRETLDALPCRKVGVVVIGERIEHRDYYEPDKSRARLS
jgi:Mrp family chromosome partitioning ATPase/capsular polysaccharide biosynthesis protein